MSLVLTHSIDVLRILRYSSLQRMDTNHPVWFRTSLCKRFQDALCSTYLRDWLRWSTLHSFAAAFKAFVVVSVMSFWLIGLNITFRCFAFEMLIVFHKTLIKNHKTAQGITPGPYGV